MPKAKLNVILLRHTPDAAILVAQAAKLCYSNSSIGELQEQIERNDQAVFINNLLDMGHLSPLEHISFTFGVEGISRACSHQLVRHRLCSYSQKSQRYVAEDGFDYIVPESIRSLRFDRLGCAQRTGEAWMSDKMDVIGSWYEELVEFGVPKEDARFLLPNACETKIVVTMNARELLHFFKVRCCRRAQWEIRNMAIEMLRLAKGVCPDVFRGAGPGCVAAGECHEGKMSCGKMDDVWTEFSQI